MISRTSVGPKRKLMLWAVASVNSLFLQIHPSMCYFRHSLWTIHPNTNPFSCLYLHSTLITTHYNSILPLFVPKTCIMLAFAFACPFPHTHLTSHSHYGQSTSSIWILQPLCRFSLFLTHPHTKIASAFWDFIEAFIIWIILFTRLCFARCY